MNRNLLTPLPNFELAKGFEGGGASGVVLASSGVALLVYFRVFEVTPGEEAGVEEKLAEKPFMVLECWVRQ